MYSIEFNHVWKRFKKGEKIYSLRDAIPALFKKALAVNNVLGKEEFWALKDVNFNVKKGEFFGIIGDNGAGKSTCLKLLAGIIKPNNGRTKVNGRISALIEVTAGFHPELTGRENIYLNGTIMGMTRKEIDNKFDEIVDFSGIREFIDTPVKRYSSGMYSRLGFSVAAHIDSDVLLVDEVLSVGDMAFQTKCAKKMRELLTSKTITIILVSHNLALIQSLCERVILLNKGTILKEGAPDKVIPFYQEIAEKNGEKEFKDEMITSEHRIMIKQDILVNINEVSMQNGANKRKKDFIFGESISIRVYYETKKTIDNPIFNLNIFRDDGVLCCASCTKYEKINIEKINGSGIIRINLGNINLAPGTYLAEISVHDKDFIHHYAIAKKYFFRMESDGIHYGDAVFLPEINWELEK